MLWWLRRRASSGRRLNHPPHQPRNRVTPHQPLAIPSQLESTWVRWATTNPRRQQLAQGDRYQFQWWTLSLVKAKSLGGQEGSKIGKKDSDKGIDGVITFINDNTGKLKQVLVQVKSGDIRDLVGTVQRENAVLGVFTTLEPPSRDMSTEAVTAGYYESPGWNQKYSRIQIRTITELLKGARIEMPPQFGTFKQATKVKQDEGQQAALEF